MKKVEHPLDKQYPISFSVFKRNGLNVKEVIEKDGLKTIIVELNSSPCAKNHQKGVTFTSIGLPDGEYPDEEFLYGILYEFTTVANISVDKFSECFLIRLKDALKEIRKELIKEKKKAS